MNFKEIVYGAGQVLKSHALGKKANVEALWSTVEWRFHDKQEIKAHAELCVDELAIRLYPSLLTCPEGGHCVLREFGLLLLSRADDKGRNLWRNKLGLPEAGQIASFQGKLKDPELRAKVISYREIIDGYLTAFDRYVALNLTNALQMHNIPFADSQGVNIYQWGPTCEYANRKRYHSLVPLTTVYASREQNDNFGVAFADLFIEDLGSVREKSVAEEMRKLIKHIVELAA